jgi:hypothetical protein
MLATMLGCVHRGRTAGKQASRGDARARRARTDTDEYWRVLVGMGPVLPFMAADRACECAARTDGDLVVNGTGPMSLSAVGSAPTCAPTLSCRSG